MKAYIHENSYTNIKFTETSKLVHSNYGEFEAFTIHIALVRDFMMGLHFNRMTLVQALTHCLVTSNLSLPSMS